MEDQSTIRVLSYLYTPDFVVWLTDQGVDVDLMETFHRDVWPHKTHELEDGIGFVQEIAFYRYRCSIVPVPNDDKDPVAMEMLEKFITMQRVVGIECIVIHWDDTPKEMLAKVRDLGDKVGTDPKIFNADGEGKLLETVKSTGLPPVTSVRLKRRWPLATTPPWMRICHMIVTLIVGDKQEEPAGTMADLDSGDGAMLQFLRGRFGACELQGYCQIEDEKELARRVDPKMPIGVLGPTEEVREYDYIVCNDAELKDLDRWRKVVEKCARKKGVITLLKKQDDMPDPNKLRDDFGKWKTYEIPGHYAFYWEVTHET